LYLYSYLLWFWKTNIICIHIRLILKNEYYSYSYSFDFEKRILFVFVFGWFWKTNIIRIRIWSKIIIRLITDENLAKDYETKWKHFLRQFELKSISIIIRNVKLLSKSQYCKRHLSVETVCTMLVYLCNVMPSDSSLRVYPRKVLRTVLGQVRSDWRSGLEQHPTDILRWISGHIWKICWLGVVVLLWKLDSYRRQIIFTYKF